MHVIKKLTHRAIKALIKPRPAESHKGTFGHALIIAGNKGRIGAAIIAAKACMRAGTGLLTVNVPQNERFILQVAVPEAMLTMREQVIKPEIYSAVGIGPAIGIDAVSKKKLLRLIAKTKCPMVFDADALTIIAGDKKILNKIPKGTILTPHPKEFDRLLRQSTNSEERIEKAIAFAKKYNVVLILKGHHTLITFNGESFSNTTGNTGLSKGGSGDALTGIITSLLAQGYDPFTAAKTGVFVHGLAADIALSNQSQESMMISDVIECLGKAFKELQTLRK